MKNSDGWNSYWNSNWRNQIAQFCCHLLDNQNSNRKNKLLSAPSIWLRYIWAYVLKFIYSEKATKFCKIFPLLLSVCTVVKSKGKISQNYVAFSEYMNFKNKINLIFLFMVSNYLQSRWVDGQYFLHILSGNWKWPHVGTWTTPRRVFLI